jgi:hypothetical protein
LQDFGEFVVGQGAFFAGIADGGNELVLAEGDAAVGGREGAEGSLAEVGIRIEFLEAAAVEEVVDGAGDELEGVVGCPGFARNLLVELPAVADGGQAEAALDLGVEFGETVAEGGRFAGGAAAGGDVDQPAFGRIGGGDDERHVVERRAEGAVVLDELDGDDGDLVAEVAEDDGEETVELVAEAAAVAADDFVVEGSGFEAEGTAKGEDIEVLEGDVEEVGVVDAVQRLQGRGGWTVVADAVEICGHFGGGEGGRQCRRGDHRRISGLSGRWVIS